MKKILYFLFTVCTLLGSVSCSSDKSEELPMIYIGQPRYSLAKGSVEIKAIAEVASTKDMAVSVSFAGAAKEGVDFTLSDPSFLFKAGETEATITLSRIEESIGEDSKELIVNMRDIPENYQLGLMNYTAVEFMGSQGLVVSFNEFAGVLTLESGFSITLETMKGAKYKAATDIQFPLEVDPASTAVEGEHFEFVGGPYATVKARMSDGNVQIKFLKREEGKDKLILKLANKDGFAFGSNMTTSITVQGAAHLAGKWAFDKITDLEYLEVNYGYMSDMEKIPKGSANDILEFVGDTYTQYTFKPQMESDLKNYFGNETRTIEFGGEVGKYLYEASSMRPPVVNMSTYLIPDINISFSKTKVDKRTAKVWFRVIEVDKEDVLECTIEDFVPVDFLAEVQEGMGTMEYSPLRYHFKRVK